MSPIPNCAVITNIFFWTKKTVNVFIYLLLPPPPPRSDAAVEKPRSGKRTEKWRASSGISERPRQVLLCLLWSPRTCPGRRKKERCGAVKQPFTTKNKTWLLSSHVKLSLAYYANSYVCYEPQALCSAPLKTIQGCWNLIPVYRGFIWVSGEMWIISQQMVGSWCPWWSIHAVNLSVRPRVWVVFVK